MNFSNKENLLKSTLLNNFVAVVLASMDQQEELITKLDEGIAQQDETINELKKQLEIIELGLFGKYDKRSWKNI